MTRDEAKAELARMCAASSYPELADTDLDALVTLAGRIQADQTIIYTDLNAAAAEGWRRKAGIASADFTVKGGDGATANLEAVFQQCMRMVSEYKEAAAVDAARYTRPQTDLWTANPNSDRGTTWSIEDLVGNL